MRIPVTVPITVRCVAVPVPTLTLYERSARGALLVALAIISLSSASYGQGSVSDAARAERFLENARGANPVMCELAMQSVDRRYGNWGSTARAPDAIVAQRDLLEWAAQEVEDAGVVPVLASALADDDACVRRLAARLFGRVTHPSAVAALATRLRDRDDRTRQMAAIALGYLESSESVGNLLDLLGDDVAVVRAAATWALGAIEDKRAVDALTQLLANDPDPAVRRQAAWALGNIH